MGDGPVAIVIDANIGCALRATPSDSARRRWAFLDGVTAYGHAMAVDPTLWDEWDRNASADARAWLAEMRRTGRLRQLRPRRLHELDSAVRELMEDLNDPGSGVPGIVNRDRHLVETAFASDRRVASGEDACWRWFCHLASHWPRLQEIVWVNPDRDNTLDQWLADGCPAEPHRTLHP